MHTYYYAKQNNKVQAYIRINRPVAIYYVLILNVMNPSPR